eukprot:TRINITY_DN7279_c0_g1_i4.p1 TRINITY_DN7279_c0_g1~~TRINITY_DN7279_c0_g1_i4.p1  ORF type:complete len:179 (-),score=35.49 TRINITY_DN7279_c0_g1_i4:129-665(-)
MGACRSKAKKRDKPGKNANNGPNVIIAEPILTLNPVTYSPPAQKDIYMRVPTNEIGVQTFVEEQQEPAALKEADASTSLQKPDFHHISLHSGDEENHSPNNSHLKEAEPASRIKQMQQKLNLQMRSPINNTEMAPKQRISNGNNANFEVTSKVLEQRAEISQRRQMRTMNAPSEFDFD